jgi:hypothetical protein
VLGHADGQHTWPVRQHQCQDAGGSESDYRKNDAKALQGSETRKIEMPLQEPLYVEATGFDIVRAWILPNFYFHVVTAYDILRHNGVELGKRDYMGGILAPYIRQRG